MTRGPTFGELALLALGVGTTVYIATRPTGFERPPRPPKPSPGTGGTDPRPSELDAFGVPYARAAADPLWPLSQDTRTRDERRADGSFAWARGKVSADFGDARPYGSSSPSRHHVGEDLRAPAGALIVATQRGIVTAIDDDWFEGTGALLVYFEDADITANFGETDPTSPLDLGLAVGTVVERGQAIAAVGRTAQLHFELYRGRQRRTFQWPWSAAPPAEVLDPTQYLELAAKTVPA